MLTSLNVVSMAVEFFASSNALPHAYAGESSAHVFRYVQQGRLRRRSSRCRSRLFRRGFARCFSTSSRVRRPPTPVPLRRWRRGCVQPRVGGSPGLTHVVLLFQRRLLALRRSGRFLLDLALVSLPALLPSRRRPRIYETLRLYLHLPEPHPECRLLCRYFQYHFVSFDFYQHFIT